jgi:hypothetical protein
VASALLLHDRDSRLRGEEDAVDIGGHDLAVQLLRDVGDPAGSPDAGPVDERVDAAEPLQRRLDDASRDIRIADITRDGHVVGFR